MYCSCLGTSIFESCDFHRIKLVNDSKALALLRLSHFKPAILCIEPTKNSPNVHVRQLTEFCYFIRWLACPSQATLITSPEFEPTKHSQANTTSPTEFFFRSYPWRCDSLVQEKQCGMRSSGGTTALIT